MNNRLALLNKVAVDLINYIDPEKLLQEILQQAVSFMGAANGAISLEDEEDLSLLVLRFGVGIDAGRTGYRVRKTDGLIGKVWMSGEVIVRNNYNVWENRILDPRLDKISTVISSPVVLGGKTIGVMQLSWENPCALLNADELSMYEHFARIASAALENAALFQQLQDEKRLINNLFDGIPGIIYLLDEKGQMSRWNKKLEEISGYGSEEISRMHYLQFFRGEDIKRIPRLLKRAVKTGFAEVEADIYRRNGTRRNYYFTAIPLHIQGKIFITGIGVDITCRKKMENELRVHHIRLEAVVSDRTAELSSANQELLAMNEEMTAMNKELQVANKRMEIEIKLRREKEKQLLLREQQYHATARLLSSHAEDASDRIALMLNDALKLVGAPAGYVGFFDETNNIVIRRHCFGPIDFENMASQTATTGMMAQVIRKGETVHVEDYRKYPERINAQELELTTTVIMVPLIVNKKVKGLIAAHWLEDIHPLSEDDILVLEQYSNFASAYLDRMNTHAEIQYLAYHDTLTGLANRTSLNLWLEEELAKARRGELQGVLFFIDLDELKVVNDTFGHSVGDDMILTAGCHIKEAFGKEAFCARIGGDEFIVAISGGNKKRDIAVLADQVLRVLSRDYNVFGERVPISASIGVVMYPEHGETPDEILKNADSAMYAAKASGRNCWTFYEAALQKDEYETMMLTNSLRRAMERDELTLHFQPQVRVQDQTIAGFEALMRWNSAEYGSVPPGRFIPLAEKSGVIVSIGEWALREACFFARKLADNGWGSLHVAVNISPRQLVASDFIDKFLTILAETGVEARQIELEVTESILIESMEESGNILERLRERGVSVALDDFGTGYSSLTYLRRLPVNTLKLDKSFIDGIVDDGRQAEYVGFIIDLAHSLNLLVVAEGVETQDQVEKLLHFGCDCFQGFVFSRPVPKDQALSLLR